MYWSNRRRLIKRLFPTHKTNRQFWSFVRSRSLLIPIPEYAAASSNVKLLFSHTGTDFISSSPKILYISRRLRLSKGPETPAFTNFYPSLMIPRQNVRRAFAAASVSSHGKKLGISLSTWEYSSCKIPLKIGFFKSKQTAGSRLRLP